MQVTLTQYTTPRLLEYLESIPGVKDRSIVLKSLAERALEAGLVPFPLPIHSPAAEPTATRKTATPKTTPNKASPGVTAKRKAAAPTPKGRPASRNGRTAK
ncbi:hypothetical protein CNECB9_3760041 [Cupriavidus necator]|uniref:Uncharacterized protein n=1 Tax=Cupriavidus necator TaxID=106590 RepID=A0A1K0IIS2_CUPNE|nr:hypothetical protein CNECB9_3760041 [Cupriavidus necator]